ncbi:HDOD domain-containing protein [Rhodothermus profundi]|nr:HDOD domain-containing protein [Rhodothermus profundi]
MLNSMTPSGRSVPATKFQADLNVRFPPLPRTASEVARLLSDDSTEPNLEQLIEIVHADPIVTQLVLRRINSAYYGLRRRITEIQKAIALLGFLEVSNIVLTAAMLQLREAVSNPEQEHIFDNLMRLSVGSAIYAQRLSQWLQLPYARRVFTAALLHASGRLILLYNRPDDYEALWYTNEEGALPSADAERTIFGVSYLELNEQAANAWNLPEELGLMLSKLESPKELPTPELKTQAALVATGSAVAEQLHLTHHDTVFLPEQARLLLGYTLTEAQLIERLEAERSETERYLQMLLKGNGNGNGNGNAEA